MIGTPGVVQLVGAATAAVLAYLSGPSAATVTVVTACAGGRHRAPVVADLLSAALAERGVTATVAHRDLHMPVVQRLVCDGCGQHKPDVEVMDDPFSTALYPERDDHESMTLCALCARDRFEES